MSFKFTDRALAVFFIRFAAAGIVLILQLVILWLEPVWLSGIFFLVYTLFQIFSVISRFGADIYIVREYHSLAEPEVKKKYNQAYLTSFFLSIPLSLVFFILLLLYVNNWSHSSSLSFSSLYGVASISLLLPFFSSSNIIYYIYQAQHKVSVQVLGLNLIQPFLFLLLYLIIKCFFLRVESVLPIVIAFYVSVIIYFFISKWLAKRIGMLTLVSRNNLKDSIFSLKSKWQFVVASAGTQMIGWTPYLLSSYMLGPGFASLFNVIQRFAMVTSFFSMALNSVAAPKIAEWSKSGQWDLINKVFWNNTKKLSAMAVLYTMVCWLGLMLSGKVADNYLIGAAIILLAYAINCGSSICGYFFQNASRIKTLNIVIYSLGALLPIVTYFFALYFDVIGAAFSILVAVAGVNIVLFPLAILDLTKKQNKNF